MILQGKEQEQKRCTCQVGEKCRQCGCHVLGGPSAMYPRWRRGITVCDDCDGLGIEEEAEKHARRQV
jgi:hypothetical protein